MKVKKNISLFIFIIILFSFCHGFEDFSFLKAFTQIMPNKTGTNELPIDYSNNTNSTNSTTPSINGSISDNVLSIGFLFI